MSRPCVKCVQRLTRLPEYSGYRIRNVYYSTASADNTNNTWITKIRLSHLANQSYQHIPRFQTINGVAKIGNRWRARPQVGGKHHNLGYFENARQAADAVRGFLSIRSTNHKNIHSHIHDTTQPPATHCHHNHGHHHHHVCSEHSHHECDHDHHHDCSEIESGETGDDIEDH